MKNKKQIEERIKSLEKDLEEYQEKYDNLNQISMQGPDGSYLEARINKTKGEINGLRWVLGRY